MQNLTIWDALLTPIYIFILTYVAKHYRDKKYPPRHRLRSYYLRGLYVKFAGAIFIGLIYEYYYGGGDTINYFHHIQVVNSAFGDSFSTWFKLITHQSLQNNPELYPYIRQMEWYNDPSSYTVVIIGAVFGLFNGTTYMPIAMLFAYFSFTGIWAMYRTFTNLYPRLHKELAIAFLFIPSIFVWGSSIFKDTLCMFGLGWLTYCTFAIFINRDFSQRNIGFLILSFYLIFRVKLYILMAFIPALSLWLLITYSSRIRVASLRFVVKIAFILLSIGAFFFFTRVFADQLQKYSLDEIAQTAATTRGWITSMSGDEGSGYDLGEFDPSIGGMLKKFIPAVVVTLFRPFPWEAKKVIVFLSALEALAFVYLTIRAFYKQGFINSFIIISKDPNLLFCLVYSVIFAFAVGISSYNFGALSRYKIPCLPFYATFLIILINYNKRAVAQQAPRHIKRTVPKTFQQ